MFRSVVHKRRPLKPSARRTQQIACLPLYLCWQYPDPRDMQINLTGFLNAKNARTFMTEMWELLCSAQDNVTGIPTKFLEQKKEEIKKRQVRKLSTER